MRLRVTRHFYRICLLLSLTRHQVRISYDGYKEFMIEQLGDTDTEEEILKGFKLMNRQVHSPASLQNDKSDI